VSGGMYTGRSTSMGQVVDVLVSARRDAATGHKIRFAPADRAFLAAPLHPLRRDVLRKVRLLVQPETVLRWHRDLISRHHARISHAPSESADRQR
jgi:hypothetical protein